MMLNRNSCQAEVSVGDETEADDGENYRDSINFPAKDHSPKQNLLMASAIVLGILLLITSGLKTGKYAIINYTPMHI